MQVHLFTFAFRRHTVWALYVLILLVFKTLEYKSCNIWTTCKQGWFLISICFKAYSQHPKIPCVSCLLQVNIDLNSWKIVYTWIELSTETRIQTFFCMINHFFKFINIWKTKGIISKLKHCTYLAYTKRSPHKVCYYLKLL